MGELLMHQSSLCNEGNHHGCMQSLIRFFEFYHRRRLRKLLPYKHHVRGKHDHEVKLGKVEQPVSITEDKSSLLENGEDSSAEYNNNKNRSSGKAGVRYLLSKMSRRKEKEQKVSRVAPRLTRTTSIHYLECDDYVVTGEFCSEHGSSTFLENVGTNISLEQSNDHVALLELHNASMEIFSKNLEEPTRNSVDDLHYTYRGAVLTKSGSLPGTGHKKRIRCLSEVQAHPKGNQKLSVNGELQLSTPGNTKSSQAMMLAGRQIKNGESIMTDLDPVHTSSNFEILSNGELKDQKDTVIVSSRFKNLREKIKDVIRKNRKDRLRISMDRFLHRIPYGQKVSEDTKEEQSDESASHKYDVASPKSTYPSKEFAFNSKFAPRSVQRSRSLAESLDRYSRLFEKSSFGQSSKRHDSLKLVEDISLQEKQAMKRFGRLFSNPELGSSFTNLDLLRDGLVDSDHYSKALSATPLPKEDTTVVDNYTVRISSINHRNIGVKDKEQDISIDDPVENKLCKTCNSTEIEKSGYIPLHEQETGKDSFGPPQDLMSEDLEVKPTSTYCKELDSVQSPLHQLNIGEVDFHKLPTPIELTEYVGSSVHIDEKLVSEYNYVRDILSKSGFCNGASHGLNFTLRRQGEYEFDVDKDESELSLYQELLFDLINETLLEIYGDSISHSHGILRYDSTVRPFPTGNHVLEEVWRKINWHLQFNEQMDLSFPDIIVRDYSKKDNWMNLGSDIEYVGIEVEALILDDLVDELTFDDLLSLHPV